MSLIGIALRISAVRALEASGIFPEGRVYDSAFLPIDQVASDQPEPFAILAIETIKRSPSGRDVSNGDHEIEFVIEIALTKAITVTVPDGEATIDFEMVETDAGLEASLALIERQVMTCLYGRGGGDWGDVFRSLNSQVREIISRRGVSAKDGVRFVARQIVQTLVPISEPPIAKAIDDESPLAAFIALALADDQLEGIARAMREAIEGKPTDWPALYNAAALLGGYTDAEGAALGLEPLEPEADPPTIDEITIADENGRDMTVDAATVDVNLTAN